MTQNRSRIYGLFIALLVVTGTFGYAFIMQPSVIGGISTYEIKQFNSYDELTSYIASGTGSSYSYSWRNEAGAMIDGINTAVPSIDESGEKSDGQSIDYSQTNVQVEGVDEPDVIKTDGTYLYIVSNNEVIIVYAYPTDDAEIIARISFDDNLTVQNLFIYIDLIIVFAVSYNYPVYRLTNDIYEETDIA